MRKLALTTAAAATILVAGSWLSNPAEAIGLGAPAGVRAAIADTDMTQSVYYVCRWTPYGRRCWWRPGYHYWHHRWWR